MRLQIDGAKKEDRANNAESGEQSQDGNYKRNPDADTLHTGLGFHGKFDPAPSNRSAFMQ
jgi:hypothetical protein